MADANQLTLTVNGKDLKGWTSVLVTRGIERMPNTFVIEATQKNPVYADAVGVKEGAPCTVALGEDLVITGYVDAVIASYAAGDHTVRLQGRGKCQDLVDCSAEWKGSQISGASAFEIAQKLAAPYGIQVSAPDGNGPEIPQFNINVGDTPADVLELITRHAGFLYYEGTDGNLILANVATDEAGSGFVEGQNIQAATFLRSQAQRFSEYRCSLLSVDTSGLFQDQDGLFYFQAYDPNVGRNRKLALVAEGVMGGLELCKKRAIWEAARRAGRGRQVVVLCDSWRDAKGQLWRPNSLAPLSLPGLNLTDALYCIAEVAYRRNLQEGTVAELVLMPQESFEPQPVQIQPLIGGLTPTAAPAAA